MLGNISTPGPGEYKPPRKTFEGPKFPFGLKTSLSSDRLQTAAPGPGQYQPYYPSLTPVAYSFSTRSLSSSKLQQESPGPGAYEHNSFMSTSARGSGVFGSEERDQNFLSKTNISNPGPGSYTPGNLATLKRIPPGFGFGNSTRDRSAFTQKGKDSPGPNLYAKPPIVGKDGPAVSFVPRRSESFHQKNRDLPGPGSYEPRAEG